MSLVPPHPAAAPLNALRAFEAAARHQSFLRAAEELAVSPGAVAQQIRKLEDWSGARLFERHAQGVSLTPLGARLLPALTDAFAQIGQVSRALRQGAGTVPVRIAALPAIAQLWLGPRLSMLREAMPQVEISVHALDRAPALTHGSFDLALYPATPDTVGVQVLAAGRMGPVAAPGIAAAINGPSDLAHAVLIHDSAWRDDWRVWLDSQGLTDRHAGAGPTYSLYSLAVERCIAGDGVMIGHAALIEAPLGDGRLVWLFPERGCDAPGIGLRLPEALPDDAATRQVARALRDL